MKKILLSITICCLAFLTTGYTQNLAINADGTLPNANAILDVKSANKGVLIPRMSTTARNAIPLPRAYWYMIPLHTPFGTIPASNGKP